MTDDLQINLKKEYILSCVTALSVASLSLFSPEHNAFRGLPLIGLAALVIVLTAYFRWVRHFDVNSTEKEDLNRRPRLRRMAVLWYVCSAVLGSSLIKAPLFGIIRSGTKQLVPLQWFLALLGLVAIGFTATRLWKIAFFSEGSK